jgi:excisionase family DNA binding protein
MRVTPKAAANTRAGSTAPAEPKFYSVQEVACILGVTDQTVYSLIQRGQLPAIRLGDDGRTAFRIEAEAFYHVLREVWPMRPGDGTEIRGGRGR